MKTKTIKLLLGIIVTLGLSFPAFSAGNYALNLPGGDGDTSNVNISGLNLTTLPFTVEMWIKPNGSQIPYAGLFYHRGTANCGLYYAAGWQGSNMIRMDFSGTNIFTPTVSFDEWHHVAVVVTTTSKQIYIDNKLAVESTADNNTPYDFTSGDLYLGYDKAVINRTFKGLIDEVRVWNVAKTATEIEAVSKQTLNGNESGLIAYYNFDDGTEGVATDLTANKNGVINGGKYVPGLVLSGQLELENQFEQLDLGDLSGVTENLNLPSTLGVNGVTCSWKSSNPAVLDSLGNVTLPEKFDQYVTLTATLSIVLDGSVLSKSKTFIVKVLGQVGTPEVIAKWMFSNDQISLSGDTVKVSDVGGSSYVGSLMNDASIRTMGITEPVTVLDLGNGTGYFDMGEAIGETMYSLGDFSISTFFYIDSTYSALTSNGNFLYTFSNTIDAPTERNGYLLGRMGNMSMETTASYYATGNQGVYTGSAAPKGSWHHYAYVQSGTTGKLFLDGVEVKSGVITNLPYKTLPVEGRSGTLYNWLGRSCYPSDVYLRNTLLYDFSVYSIALTGDNFLLDLGVSEIIQKLNTAYEENPNVKDNGLENEQASLTLGDLTAVSVDLILPTQGAVDTEVSISWESSYPAVIDISGKVVQPNYHDSKVLLTATLSKGIQSLTKSFIATVPMLPGSGFTNDLLVHYDFSNTVGDELVDKAEKHLTGKLKNDAKIREIGTDASGKHIVLDLGDSIGYFDMGIEVGKIMAGLENYTVSAYFRIDTAYNALSSNGNFLWTISNSDDAMKHQNGYIIASLKNQSVSTSPGYYTAESGNQAVSSNLEAMKGGWHNLTYTQEAGKGVLYVDGTLVVSIDTLMSSPKSIAEFNLIPYFPFNWIGRSNYTGDVYLRQTLVSDIRIYKRALTDIEILALELGVGDNILALDAAYQANPNVNNAFKSISVSEYKLYVVNHSLQIQNLKGDENVQIFDISGRLIAAGIKSQYNLNNGVYVVRINEFVSKIIIK